MMLLFILAIWQLGSSLFLYSSGTMVMAVQLLGYYEGCDIGIVAAFRLVRMVAAERADDSHQPVGPGRRAERAG